MEVETVKVVSEKPDEQGEYVVINKADYDEAIHVLWPVVTKKK
jgi:hypothetical protein